jgi:hypothetical protein
MNVSGVNIVRLSTARDAIAGSTVLNSSRMLLQRPARKDMHWWLEAYLVNLLLSREE